MKVSTRLLPLDVGDFTLDEALGFFAEGAPQVTVAVTRGTQPATGWPLVRLVGEPADLLVILQDAWCMSADEASAHLE